VRDRVGVGNPCESPCMAGQDGTHFLERPQGDKALLMSGIPGLKPAEMRRPPVRLADGHIPRLRDSLPSNVTTLSSTPYNSEKEFLNADLVIGAALALGAKTPHLVTHKMLRLIRLGPSSSKSQSIRLGALSLHTQQRTARRLSRSTGSITTASQLSQGQSRTQAPGGLANATFPYALWTAHLRWQKAVRENPS
jgi:alanine dehydrogenase